MSQNPVENSQQLRYSKLYLHRLQVLWHYMILPGLTATVMGPNCGKCIIHLARMIQYSQRRDIRMSHNLIENVQEAESFRHICAWTIGAIMLHDCCQALLFPYLFLSVHVAQSWSFVNELRAVESSSISGKFLINLMITEWLNIIIPRRTNITFNSEQCLTSQHCTVLTALNHHSVYVHAYCLMLSVQTIVCTQNQQQPYLFSVCISITLAPFVYLLTLVITQTQQ